MLLTETPAVYIDDDGWVRDVGGSGVIRTMRWGVATERRYATASGLEVDVGVVTPSWASVSPLDAGTRGVALDGLRVINDPDGLLERLAAYLDTRIA